MALTLDLPEKLERELHALAESTGVGVEGIVLAALLEYTQKRAVDTTAPSNDTRLDNADFEMLSRGVLRDYRGVLERLA